jgi:hypothetical protein
MSGKPTHSAIGMGWDGEHHIHRCVDGHKMTEKVFQHMPGMTHIKWSFPHDPRGTASSDRPSVEFVNVKWEKRTGMILAYSTRQLAEDDQKTPRVRLWHEGEDEGPNRLDG